MNTILKFESLPLPVTSHAIDRFKERVSPKAKKIFKIAFQLNRFVKEGKRVRLRKKYRLMVLLNNNCKEAEYYFFRGWIVVVEDKIIKTIHKNEYGRFKIRA